MAVVHSPWSAAAQTAPIGAVATSSTVVPTSECDWFITSDAVDCSTLAVPAPTTVRRDPSYICAGECHGFKVSRDVFDMQWIFTYYTENDNTYQERWKLRSGASPAVQPQNLTARMYSTVPCGGTYSFDTPTANPGFTGDYIRNPAVACNTALAGERIVRVDVEARGDVYALFLCSLGGNGTRSTTHTYFYGVSTLDNVAFTPTNGSICPNVNYPVTATTTPYATSYEWQLAQQSGTTRTGLGSIWSTTPPNTQFSVPVTTYAGRSISIRGRAVRSGQPGCNNGRSAWNYATFRPVSAVPGAATGLFFPGPVMVGSPTSILLQPPQDSPVPVASYQWTCSRQGTGPVNLFAGGLFTATSTSTAVALTFPSAGIYTFNVQSFASAATTCPAGATYSQTFSIGILPSCPLQTQATGTKTIYNRANISDSRVTFTGVQVVNFDPTLTYSFGVDQILPLGSRNIGYESLQDYNSARRGIQFWIDRTAPYASAPNPQTFRLTITISSGSGAPTVCRQTITIPPPCPETPSQCPPPLGERPAAGNGGGSKRFSVWPNPIAGGYLTITAPANGRCFKATLHTLQGQEVRTAVSPEPKGAMELQIPVTDLRKGTYLLRTFDGEQAVVTRVVIE